MVAIEAIRRSNVGISELPRGMVSLFLGGTSGIGRSALAQYVKYATEPRVYIVARRAAAIEGLLAELRRQNPGGTYIVIEKNVSLICETNDVVDYVKAREKKLDYLFESVGFISFSGRHDTIEGLEPSMTTRYYSRLRAVQGLLPLLKAAEDGRVVSILAGGYEGKIDEQDLDLRKAGNYSVITSAFHSATMLTLAYEHLAKENPGISFVHGHPGWVATPLLDRGSTGIVWLLMHWVVQPLGRLFATSAEDAGTRALFYLTSARYSNNGGGVPLSEGLEVSPRSQAGVYLSNEKSESADNESILADYRARAVDELVWRHTVEIFDACAARSAVSVPKKNTRIERINNA